MIYTGGGGGEGVGEVAIRVRARARSRVSSWFVVVSSLLGFGSLFVECCPSNSPRPTQSRASGVAVSGVLDVEGRTGRCFFILRFEKEEKAVRLPEARQGEEML